jgi:putative ABC transport system permease protein
MRHAIRSLWKTKGFTAIAVATIAVGVGANTAVFSVVDAVLLRPLPFKHADRIFTLTGANPKRDMLDATISYPQFVELAARDRMFAQLSAYTYDSFNLTGSDRPEELPGVRVTASFFDVLGVPMAAGPGFKKVDDSPGGPAVVVLAKRFWSRQFSMSREAIGASLTLNGLPHTVVGALGIDLPPPFADVDVWTTRPDAMNGFTRQQIAAGLGYLWAIGRLPAGVRAEQVQPEVDAIAHGYARAHVGNTDADPEASLRLRPIRERTIGNTRPPLLVLTVVVGLVLLIACANVANLLLVRATARAHETAVRAALGASRLQLMKWLGAESAVLALAGGTLGTLLALWLVELASAVVRGLPRGAEVEINAPVMAFSLAASAGAGVLFGVAPALRAARQAPANALHANGRAASPQRSRLSAGLVVGEVALSLMLLVAAGLLLRGFVKLLKAPVGFRSEGLVSMRVSLPTAKYADPASMRTFVARLIPAIEALPGVTGASATMSLPPLVTTEAPYQTADGPQRPIAERPFAAWTGITPSYFTTMGIPLLAGRGLTAADDERAPLVTVISEGLARRAWPAESPIGKRMLIGRFQGFAEVVGVVGDVKNAGLGQPPEPQAYTPYAQRPWPTMGLVVRAAGGDPLALVPSIRAAVLSVDRDQPITEISALQSSLSDSLATARFTTTLLLAFATMALVMAAAGLYGVIAYTVERRTREVGIRVALGADARSVLTMVVGQGLRLVAAGMGIGLALAIVAARVMRSVVFDIAPADPVSYAGAIVLFALTALVATLVPARRALGVDPLIALRTD